MPHVGVERFRPSDDEHNGAHREERSPGVGDEEVECVNRIERGDHGGARRDFASAQQRERHEPHAHDGPEHRTDRRRAALLRREQANHDHD